MLPLRGLTVSANKGRPCRDMVCLRLMFTFFLSFCSSSTDMSPFFSGSGGAVFSRLFIMSFICGTKGRSNRKTSTKGKVTLFRASPSSAVVQAGWKCLYAVPVDHRVLQLGPFLLALHSRLLQRENCATHW